MVNPCSLCTARCCKQYLITVTSFDVLKIHENTRKPIEEFAELADPRILNIDNDTILEFYDSNAKYPDCKVLAIKSGPCHFLTKDDKCSIHEFAPLTCKRYPFGPDGKITEGAICPAISKVLFSFMKVENDLPIRPPQPKGCGFIRAEGQSCVNSALPPKVKTMSFRAELTHDKFNVQLKAYKEIVKKWNSRRGKLSECMEFLIEESKKEN
ncbi:MAG: YkgJ family cysteine cluster protein [Candidatus Micrarchaeota archaeon]|nr:YkgJ family cysteine cluster protein [Candidatus Micrarchaeota archaeon]